MNDRSMFLTNLCEKEIVYIVTYFKNKMSTDVHDIDLSLVKKVISQISKPLTRICNMSDSRLSNFIDRHSILNDNQYGFRKNRSTSLALSELVEKFTAGLDNKDITIGIVVDLKKAFDTIYHGILLQKFEHYGVRGIMMEWLKSYL